jgi:hypothetical protein
MSSERKRVPRLVAAAAASAVFGVAGGTTLAAGHNQAGEGVLRASPALHSADDGARGATSPARSLWGGVPVRAPSRGRATAASPASTTTTTRVALAGTTILEGSTSVELPVTLPQPVTVSVYETVTQGRGRYVGFVMHQDGGWLTDIFYRVMYSYCTSPGCTGEAPPTNVGAILEPGTPGGGPLDPGSPGTATISDTLPAGNYHLYLLADGAPVKVTLFFHGLGGQVTLAPAQPTTTATPAPTPDFTIPSSRSNAYAAGMTRQVTGGVGGMTFITSWVFQRLPDEPTDIGKCAYAGKPPSQYPAYEDPCPGTVSGTGYIAGNEPIGSTQGPLHLANKYGSFFVGAYIEAPLDWSIGGFVNTVGPVVETPHLQELWLDF